jgi:tetratricopeptide (TPR) repeat protein
MIPSTDVALPSDDRLPSTSGVATRRVGLRGNWDRSRTGRLLAFAVFVGLAVFNVWWYRRDSRPLPALREVSEWISQERYQDAKEMLREHLRRSPHYVEARMMLARALAGAGDLLACARELHAVPHWSPSKPEAVFREGQCYFEANHAKDSEAAWLALINEDPLHPISPELMHDGCQALLKLYAIEDRWEDAFPVIWTAYDHALPVDRPVLLMMRMRTELERIAPKESIPVLERYIAAQPDDWEAQRALARAQLAVGRLDEAARHFEIILAARPDDFRAWRDFLNMRLDTGNLESFLVLLGKPPQSAENEPETWFFRGVASDKKGDLASAVDSYQKAIELNPFVPGYHYRLGMAQERLGKREEAATHRKKSQEINNARAKLPAAYSHYFEVAESGDKPAIANACRQLAGICDKMGWGRAAQAWKRLAIEGQL